MRKWWSRARPSRQQQIDRKHQLEGEIRALAAQVKQHRSRKTPADDLERKLASLRDQHHRTRLRIDRTGRD